MCWIYSLIDITDMIWGLARRMCIYHVFPLFISIDGSVPKLASIHTGWKQYFRSRSFHNKTGSIPLTHKLFHSDICRTHPLKKYQFILVNYTPLIGLNSVQCFSVFNLRFGETNRFFGFYPESPAIVWDYNIRLALQTLWLVLKLCDWMLEWQCDKVTPSVKQLFEMEWNHGRLSKTGLERLQPSSPLPPRTTHAGYCVFRNMFYGTSLLGISHN